MDNQTPLVTEEQFAKWMQFTRDRVRKGNLDLAIFQYILGHPNLAPQVDKMFASMAAEYWQSKPLIERPASLIARVGTLKTVAELRQAITVVDCRISDWANDLMSQPAFKAGIVQTEEDVEFIFASNTELGYPQGCTRAQTYEAGLRLGWKLCFPSDAIEIRRNYLEQPNGEWAFVAMRPIADSDGYLDDFRVARNGGVCWLNAFYSRPDRVWSAGCRWVFRRR